MKLYTEEEVKKAMLTYHNGLSLEYALSKITFVELPSDEEIEEMGKDVIVYNDTKRGWFVEGLRVMRDKIGGQL